MARRPTARQPIYKNVMVELSVNDKKPCMFCQNKKISEKLYGKMYQLNDVVAHYYCIVNEFPQMIYYTIIIYYF